MDLLGYAFLLLVVHLYGLSGGSAAIIKIKNFSLQRNQPSNNGSVYFSFEVEPSIPTSVSSTYAISLYWTEELSGTTGSLTAVTRSSTYCPVGYLTTDGKGYSFSVSKYRLGSGPLTVYISVSLGCSYSYRYCYSYCSGSWRYTGRSESVGIPELKGSHAPFEVDLELWAGEKCHEFVEWGSSYAQSMVSSVVKDACQCSIANTYFYKYRFLCVHDDFVTIRGIIVRRNDSMASSLRASLQAALKSPRYVLLGKREMTLHAGPCGVNLASIDDPRCSRGNPPDTESKTWYGDFVVQQSTEGSSSIGTNGPTSLIVAVTVVSILCVLFVIAIIVLVAYIGYMKCRRKYKVHRRCGPVEEDTAHLAFGEE